MKSYIKDYILNNSNIDSCSNDVISFLKPLRITSENITRLRLDIESILLIMMENLPENTRFNIHIREHFGKFMIKLFLPGKPVNPLESMLDTGQTEDLFFFHNIVSSVNVVCDYEYAHSINILEFSVPKKPIGTLAEMIIALGGGITVGLLGHFFLSQEELSILSQDFISPTIHSIMGLISAVACVYVFVSIVVAICNTDSLKNLSKIGRKILTAFMGLNLLATILCSLSFFWIISFDYSKSESIYEFFKTIYQLIISIIPGSLVEPFVKKDTMQLLVLAVLFGQITLVLDAKVQHFRQWLNELNDIILSALRYVCRALTVIVFLCMINIFFNNQMGIIGESLYIVLPIIIVTYFIALLVCGYAKVKHSVDFHQISKELKVLAILGASTGSRTPCLTKMYEVCQNKLKLDKSLVDMGIPMSTMFMVFQKGCCLSAYALGAAVLYSVDISPTEFFTLCISAYMMVYTIPPLPLGTVTIVGMLLEVADIPAEATSVIMPIDIMIGFVITPPVVIATVVVMAILNQSIAKETAK